MVGSKEYCSRSSFLTSSTSPNLFKFYSQYWIRQVHRHPLNEQSRLLKEKDGKRQSNFDNFAKLVDSIPVLTRSKSLQPVLSPKPPAPPRSPIFFFFPLPPLVAAVEGFLPVPTPFPFSFSFSFPFPLTFSVAFVSPATPPPRAGSIFINIGSKA